MWHSHAGQRTAGAVIALFAVSACTTVIEQKPTPREEVEVWLSESPRSIAVEVDRTLPSVTLRSRDTHPVQRVGKGVGGAAYGGVYTVAAGCRGGPIGCVIGVVLAPVGMVVGGVAGAASVKSTDTVQSAGSAGEGPAKMTIEQVVDLPALLEERVVAQQRYAGRHSLTVGVAANAEERATLRLRFTDIELFGDPGENPSLAMTLRATAEIQVPGATSSNWGSYTYSGSSHWVSTWTKDDGKLLRADLRDGATAIARQAARDLAVSASRSSTAKVAWARKMAADPELEAWERARSNWDAQLLRDYLDAYPDGRFVEQAQRRLARLNSPASVLWR